MPNFQYTAIDQQGQQTTGTVQAASEAEATSQLRNQLGVYPTAVSYTHLTLPTKRIV